MIPYDLDPSLHTGQPEPQLLEDGFSAPPAAEPEAMLDVPESLMDDPVGSAHWAKSAF
jgi:hypothetical protein